MKTLLKLSLCFLLSACNKSVQRPTTGGELKVFYLFGNLKPPFFLDTEPHYFVRVTWNRWPVGKTGSGQYSFKLDKGVKVVPVTIKFSWKDTNQTLIESYSDVRAVAGDKILNAEFTINYDK